MKTMKRFGCLLLVLAMVLALGVSAMAAPQTLASSPSTTGSITINGAIANEEYTIYQIFELTFTSETDDDGNVIATGDSYSYKVCEGWEDFLATQTVVVGGNATPLFTLTNSGYVDPSSLIFTYGEEDSVVTDEIIAAMARAALAWAEDELHEINGTSVKYTYTVNETTGEITAVLDPQNVATISDLSMDENGYVTGDLTFSNLSLGYYLVGTSLGSLCMLDSTDPDAVVNEKNGTPTIEKYVFNTEDGGWEKDDDEGNGTLVRFEIVVNNINGAENLVIHDAMDGELSIPVDDGGYIDYDSFGLYVTLYTSKDATGIPLSAGENGYTFTNGECSKSGAAINDCGNDKTGCDFEIAINRALNDVDETGYIVITYYLLLDETGDTFVGDLDELDNFAQLTFATSSASPVVEAEVYSFGFEVYKYTDDFSLDYGLVIEAPFSNDNPESSIPSDNLYLMLFDSEGGVAYYATFTTLYENSGNHLYVITGWVETEEEATAIEEPEYDSETQEAYFFVPKDMTIPAYSFIQLDEDPTNPQQETNDSANVYYTFDWNQPLAGAVFEVSREVSTTDENGETTTSIQTAYFLYESELGIYLFEGWLDEGESLPEDSPYTTSLVTVTNGMIYIEGLDTGNYIVTEVAAPDGFNMLDNSIYVTIWATYDEATGSITDEGVTWTLGEEGEEQSGVVSVENNAGSKLPGTGGIGTTIFYVVGAILVCGAVVLLVTKRRTSNKDQAEA